MDCNTPGFPVLHYLPKFAQTHAHWVSDAILRSHPLLPHSPPAFSLSQHQSFPVSWPFTPKYWSVCLLVNKKVFIQMEWGWLVKVTQLCPTLCNPMDYIVCGILQARILEWIAIPFSRGFLQPRDQTWVTCIAGGFFTIWATREACPRSLVKYHPLRVGWP